MAALSVELQTRLKGRSRSISSVPLIHHDELEMTLPGTVPICKPKPSRALSTASVGRWNSSANLTSRQLTAPNIFTDPGRISRQQNNASKPPTRPQSRRQSLASALRVPINIKSDIKKMWDRRPSLSNIIPGRSTGNDANDKEKEEREVEEEPFDPNEVAEQYGVPSFFIVDAKAWEQGIRIKSAKAAASSKKK